MNRGRRLRLLFPLMTIMLAFLPTFVVTYAEDEVFIYRERGRDPFLSWVTEDGKFRGEGGVGNLEDLILEGIVWDQEGDSLVMMNGFILRKGDRIGRFLVGTITREEVTLRWKESLYKLRLPLPDLKEEMR